jgi:LysM repeat protein
MQLSTAGIHPDFAQEKRPLRRAVGVSRKDTIIIAMLVNIALLAVLFATATRQNHNNLPLDRVEPVVTRFETVSQVAKPAALPKEPVDEIDEILKSYAIQAKVTPQVVEKPAPAPAPAVVPTKQNYVEVKVKKGEALSRIAKQHNVRLEDLIILNGLESSKIRAGQVLKVPTSTNKVQIATPTSEFYVVQTGDSPWKIAKKCKISVDELLRLNNLDEEKAKNLKIGQKLRIH